MRAVMHGLRILGMRRFQLSVAITVMAALAVTFPTLARSTVPGNVSAIANMDLMPVPGQNQDCCDATGRGVMDGWQRGDLEIETRVYRNGSLVGRESNRCVNSTFCETPSVRYHAMSGDTISVHVTGSGPGGVVSDLKDNFCDGG